MLGNSADFSQSASAILLLLFAPETASQSEYKFLTKFYESVTLWSSVWPDYES
jgi:hypothetical protein